MIQENYEDSIYFFLKSGLLSRVEPHFHKNVRDVEEHSNQTEKRFWDEVSPRLMKKLNQPWAFGHDFNLFGLNIEDYLASL